VPLGDVVPLAPCEPATAPPTPLLPPAPVEATAPVPPPLLSWVPEPGGLLFPQPASRAREVEAVNANENWRREL